MLLNIANLLLKEKLLKYEDINNILENNKDISIEDFQNSLIDSGRIDSEVLHKTIRKNFNTSIEDIKDLKVDENILHLIRKKTAAENLVLPLRINDKKLVVAMADPTDLILIDELRFESGCDIIPVIASREVIRNQVINNYKIDLSVHGELLDSTTPADSTENILSKLKESNIDNGVENTDHQSSQESSVVKSSMPENITNDSTQSSSSFQSSVTKEADKTSDLNKARSEISIDTEKTDSDYKPFNPPSKPKPVTTYIADHPEENNYNTTPENEEINPFSSPFGEPPQIKSDPGDSFNFSSEEPADRIEVNKSEGFEAETANPFRSSVKTSEQIKEMEANPFVTAREEISEAEAKTDVINGDAEQKENEIVVYRTNILVVEQGKTTREIISQTLEQEGYSITLSADAIDAMSKINESRPDLILIDINLPHLDGYQLCKIIKKNSETKNIPIVMLSGKDGIFDRMKGKIAGADDYITKPFRPSNLIEIVQTLTKI